MMQERERKPANVSTISGKRSVRSLPGRLKSRTRGPSLQAMILNPSCLISCSHAPPDGSVWALVGRHGAMKPLGRVRGWASMMSGEIGNGDSVWKARHRVAQRLACYAAGGGGGGFGGLGGGGFGGLGCCSMATRKVK